MVKVDLSGAQPFFTAAGPDYKLAELAHKTLAEGSGLGADFTGWLGLPQRIKDTELDAIVAAAEKIRGRSQALVAIGIGGSYLGAKGAIELLKPRPGKGDPRVFFMGNTLSADALNDTIEALGDMDFDVNVISKSGTTLEPAVSFRIFRELLVRKYGDKADEHIFATTDARRGVLKSLADEAGWPCFVVPGDVGGRFSVLSAVGLLPMAVAGIDVRRVIDAAIREFKALDVRSPENPAWQYAAARQHLYGKGYGVEILGCYEPSFRFMAEWWKQLYGESEPLPRRRGQRRRAQLPRRARHVRDLPRGRRRGARRPRLRRRAQHRHRVPQARRGGLRRDGLLLRAGLRHLGLHVPGQPLRPARRRGLQEEHVPHARQARRGLILVTANRTRARSVRTAPSQKGVRDHG